MKTLLKKITNRLREDTTLDFVPLEEERVNPEARKFIEKLNLVSFLTHSNTFSLKVDPKLKESLNRYFTKRFIYRQNGTPGVYLFGELGKKMVFAPLSPREVKMVRDSGTPFVAIEVLKGKDFNVAYLNTLLKNLRKQIKELPIEIQKELDLDEQPLRRDILVKSLKGLTKKDVDYIRTVKKAVEETSIHFLRELALFSKEVFENIPKLKRGEIPERLITTQKMLIENGEVGGELLKHSATTVNHLYELIQTNAQIVQDFLRSVIDIEREERNLFGLSP